MKEEVSLLAICIPTYNRCEMLVDCLLDTIYKTRKYQFPIVVFDNASTDGTQEAVLGLCEQYPQILYYRQDENVGADRNFESCLCVSPAKYSWLLGDSYRIAEDALDTLIEKLVEYEPCMLIANGFDRMQNLHSCMYDDPEKLLYDLGWHMTMISCLIYSRKLLHNTNFRRYYSTNFIQDGIIFEYLISHPGAKVYWDERNCCVGSNLKKETWVNRRFEIFGIAWTEYVLSLPYSISLPVKLKCIKEHNDQTHLFTFWTAIKMRRDGVYNVQILRKSKLYLPYFWGISYGLAYLIAISPRWILRMISDRNVMRIKKIVRRSSKK